MRIESCKSYWVFIKQGDRYLKLVTATDATLAATSTVTIMTTRGGTCFE